MYCLSGQKEQLAFAILGRGAKDRNMWVTGSVNDFEICLSSCHCNGHRTNMQNVALHCQGFLHFWQHILNSFEYCVAACKVAGLHGSLHRKILNLSFYGMFAKSKQRKGFTDFFVSRTSCMSFDLILSYG